MRSALLWKRRACVSRIFGAREDQAPIFDLDPQGIAFAETGTHEPPAAEADHRDARSRIEVRGHRGFPAHRNSGIQETVA
jgi:hypothetical protein